MILLRIKEEKGLPTLSAGDVLRLKNVSSRNNSGQVKECSFFPLFKKQEISDKKLSYKTLYIGTPFSFLHRIFTLRNLDSCSTKQRSPWYVLFCKQRVVG